MNEIKPNVFTCEATRQGSESDRHNTSVNIGFPSTIIITDIIAHSIT
jgi:hypothetical protein